MTFKTGALLLLTLIKKNTRITCVLITVLLLLIVACWAVFTILPQAFMTEFTEHSNKFFLVKSYAIMVVMSKIIKLLMQLLPYLNEILEIIKRFQDIKKKDPEASVNIAKARKKKGGSNETSQESQA